MLVQLFLLASISHILYQSSNLIRVNTSLALHNTAHFHYSLLNIQLKCFGDNFGFISSDIPFFRSQVLILTAPDVVELDTKEVAKNCDLIKHLIRLRWFYFLIMGDVSN